ALPRRAQQIVQFDRPAALKHEARLHHGTKAEPGASVADLELLAAIARELAGIGGDREAAEELDHLRTLRLAELRPAGADDDAGHWLEIEGCFHGRLQALVTALEAERPCLLHGPEQRVLEGRDDGTRPGSLGAQLMGAERRQHENDYQTAKGPVEKAIGNRARPFYVALRRVPPRCETRLRSSPPHICIHAERGQTATTGCRLYPSSDETLLKSRAAPRAPPP